MTALSRLVPTLERPAVAILLRGVAVTVRYSGRWTAFDWSVDDATAVPGLNSRVPYSMARETARRFLDDAEIAAIDSIVLAEVRARSECWHQALRERRRRNPASRTHDGEVAWTER